ncbi:MAG TPA: sensor domain-containing diguanylate cyclase [Pyrinomonadaceae bacterium]|nr:sensor domain-containing diguanylate cyclase [Pyrinomonadaceae bacterium]
MQVILLKDEHARPAPALIDALREAGVGASVAPAPHAAQGSGAGAQPLVVICEVADAADVVEVHAAVTRAAAAYPEATLVACRRAADTGRNVEGRRLDAGALVRLGFRAVADDPAQVPALLRELESRGGNAEGLSAHTSEVLDVTPSSVLLPENLSVATLRAAFEAVSALHFVSDQRGAAQTALAGLAPLARADRWTLYLTDTEGDGQPPRFEPLAMRGLTASERELPEGDWRKALHTDALLSLMGSESHAAREAQASAETVRRDEGDRRVVAVPLVSGDRVIAVVEAVREGAGAREFSAQDESLLSALAVPLSAALANSVRIAEAERLSLTDDLTKLNNARFLRQYLTAEIKRARRYGSQVSALFLDLDDFKEINDRHGHLVGSHMLMEMATVILTGVRDTDVVSRYGGDEFVVILPETGIEMAARVAERVRGKIAAQVFTGGRRLSLRITASFGVACFPAHAQSPQQLIAGADAAMYDAKAARKNCIRFASEPNG